MLALDLTGCYLIKDILDYPLDMGCRIFYPKYKSVKRVYREMPYIRIYA